MTLKSILLATLIIASLNAAAEQRFFLVKAKIKTDRANFTAYFTLDGYQFVPEETIRSWFKDPAAFTLMIKLDGDTLNCFTDVIQLKSNAIMFPTDKARRLLTSEIIEIKPMDLIELPISLAWRTSVVNADRTWIAGKPVLELKMKNSSIGVLIFVKLTSEIETLLLTLQDLLDHNAPDEKIRATIENLKQKKVLVYEDYGD